jgi:hypothetical protein
MTINQNLIKIQETCSSETSVFNGLHSVISQTNRTLHTTAARTSNPTKCDKTMLNVQGLKAVTDGHEFPLPKTPHHELVHANIGFTITPDIRLCISSILSNVVNYKFHLLDFTILHENLFQ